MPTYSASFTSLGNSNNVYIYLEDLPNPDMYMPVPIYLLPVGGDKKKWENDEISVDVDQSLNYEFWVHAFHGTKWNFVLTDKDTGEEVLKLSGMTGDSDEGHNISKRRGAVPPEEENLIA